MYGRTILGYKVDEFIDAGSFGSVYKVSKSNIAGTEIRALKHISIPTQKQYLEVLNSMGGDYQKADDYFAGILQNVINEIQIIRSMSAKRSVNIVAYFENDIVEHTSPRTYDIYILMEYLIPLTDYIHNNSLTVRNIIDLAKDMLNALIVCHSNNIIHRDIKESNIFVSDDGLYKLGDFGISRVVNSKSGAASMKGTPTYIAPEVYLGKEKYDNTVDLYSLGIVLYRLLNGNRGPFLPPYPNPYTSEDEDTAFEKRMKGMIPNLPLRAQNELGEVIVRALMPRDRRYSSAQEFLDAIQRAKHSLSNTELNRPISQISSTQNTAWPKTKQSGMQSKTFAVDTVPPMSKTNKVHTSNPFETVSDIADNGFESDGDRSHDVQIYLENTEFYDEEENDSDRKRKSSGTRTIVIMMLLFLLVIAIGAFVYFDRYKIINATQNTPNIVQSEPTNLEPTATLIPTATDEPFTYLSSAQPMSIKRAGTPFYKVAKKDAGVFFNFNKDDIVDVLATNDDWYLIRYSGYLGYVDSSSLTVVRTTPTPKPTPTPTPKPTPKPTPTPTPKPTPKPTPTPPPISEYLQWYKWDAWASSERPKNSPPVKAENMIDGDLNSSWDADGKNIGQSFSFSTKDRKKYTVNGFEILNGKPYIDPVCDPEWWAKNCRIKKVRVYVDGVYSGEYRLKDTGYWQTVNFDKPLTGSEFEFKITDVYYGTKYKDVCVTEIDFF